MPPEGEIFVSISVKDSRICGVGIDLPKKWLDPSK